MAKVHLEKASVVGQRNQGDSSIDHRQNRHLIIPALCFCRSLTHDSRHIQPSKLKAWLAGEVARPYCINWYHTKLSRR